MGVIQLPQRHLAQPQYAAALDRRHWLTKDITFAINGATPGFNSATSKQVSITPAGSGFSKRIMTKGVSLYTPDGGWADFNLGQDWIGPNTIITLCHVNGVDAAWGGLFAKIATVDGTYQFALGRYSVEDNLYAAVSSGSVERIIPSTVSELSGFSVIALSHSGVAATPMSFFRNGAYVGESYNLGTQPSGTGVLRLGGEPNSSAANDSDVDWFAFVRVKRVLSQQEIESVSRNIWALWQAPPRRIYLVPEGGGSSPQDLESVALTAVATTVSPALAPGSVELSPIAASSSASAASPLLQAGAATLSPSAVSSGAVPTAPLLQAGAMSLIVSPISAVASASATVIDSGVSNLAPSAVEAQVGVSVPELLNGVELGAPSVAASASVSAVLLTPGDVSLTPPATQAGAVVESTVLSAGGVETTTAPATASGMVVEPTLSSGTNLSPAAVIATAQVGVTGLALSAINLAPSAPIVTAQSFTPTFQLSTRMLVWDVISSTAEVLTPSLLNEGEGINFDRLYLIAAENRSHSVLGELRNYTI